MTNNTKLDIPSWHFVGYTIWGTAIVAYFSLTGYFITNRILFIPIATYLLLLPLNILAFYYSISRKLIRWDSKLVIGNVVLQGIVLSVLLSMALTAPTDRAIFSLIFICFSPLWPFHWLNKHYAQPVNYDTSSTVGNCRKADHGD